MDATFLPTLQGPIRDVVRNKIIYHLVAAGMTPQQIRRVSKRVVSGDDGNPVTKIRLAFHEKTGRGDLIVDVPGIY